MLNCKQKGIDQPEVKKQVELQNIAKKELKQLEVKLQENKKNNRNQFKNNQNYSYQNNKKKNNNAPNHLKPDPTQDDLCKALVLLHRDLPKRSLDKLIAKLYETIQHKNQNVLVKTITNVNKLQKGTIERDNSSIFSDHKLIVNDNSSIFSDRQSNISKQDIVSKKGMGYPGRNGSMYQNNAMQFQTLTNTLYSNIPPTMQNQSKLKSTTEPKSTAIKPMISAAASPQIKKQDLSFNSATRQTLYFHFKISDTLKINFLSHEEQKKYEAKRQLAQLFLDRGYESTKNIEDDVPPIGMDRLVFKSKLICIMTETYRKVESFIATDLKRIIYYVDHDQVRTLSSKLLNCRIQLEFNRCETFLKFIRISQALSDVTVSDQEAIQLFLALHRYIEGNDVTMQIIEKKAKIKNTRKISQTFDNFTQKTQRQKYKNVGEQKYPGNSFNMTQQQQMQLTDQLLGDYQIDEQNQHMKEVDVWSLQNLQQLIELYSRGLNLAELRESMVSAHAELQKLTIDDFQSRLNSLIEEGLSKMQVNAKTYLPTGPFLILSQQKVNCIKQYSQFSQLKCSILIYLMGLDPVDKLRELVKATNDFLSKNYIMPRRQNRQFSIRQSVHPPRNPFGVLNWSNEMFDFPSNKSFSVNGDNQTESKMEEFDFNASELMILPEDREEDIDFMFDETVDLQHFDTSFLDDVA